MTTKETIRWVVMAMAVRGFVADCGSMTTESPGLDRLLSPFSAKKHGILARDTQSGPHEALRDLCG